MKNGLVLFLRGSSEPFPITRPPREIQKASYRPTRPTLVIYPGGGTWIIIVLYTCATRESRKKGLFFEAKRDSRESRLGVKMCLFSTKRVLLDSIKGRLGVIFQIQPNMSSKKSLFGDKFAGKKLAFRGCFSWRGKSRWPGMFWKPLVTHW